MQEEDANLIYRTSDNVDIYVDKGIKSVNDFIVKYRQPGKRKRTPKHIHLLIDLLIKKCCDKELTMKFVKKLFGTLRKIEPSKSFPPKFQCFNKADYDVFNKLNNYGEYSVEFLAAIFDLIMIQEKTNYPDGILNKQFYKSFLSEKDIFSLVSAASFSGRKR
ncbi:MAG: hypothetical protein ACQEP5_01590 [Actinomycetota bacterium]